jgi:cysteine desulfurase/selenocysteine lyase
MASVRWRTEFSASADRVHMNHAGLSPLPRRVAAIVRRFADEAAEFRPSVYRVWQGRMENARASFARLVGAQSSEIAFVANTSAGLSLVAGGLPWRRGQNVVALAEEYPSNVYPWWGLRRWGVETRMVPRRGEAFGVDEVAPFVDRETQVLAVSAVDWQTGFRADLESFASFCRERGILLCVDGIQSVGALRIDVSSLGLDCLVAGSHKWLLAPEGSGVLFVSERFVERLQPVLLGWKSVHDADRYLPYHFELRDDAARFEPGSPPHLGIAALGASLELLLEVGAEPIERRILGLTEALAEGLRSRGASVVSPRGPAQRSGILTFRLGDPGELLGHLSDAGVVARVRAGGVRLSPHFYNDDDDVCRVLDAVDSYRRR